MGDLGSPPSSEGPGRMDSLLFGILFNFFFAVIPLKFDNRGDPTSKKLHGPRVAFGLILPVPDSFGPDYRSLAPVTVSLSKNP